VFTGQGDIEKTMIKQLNNSCLAPALTFPIHLMAKGFDSKVSSHDIISLQDYRLNPVQEGIHDRKRTTLL
jgi:hypothetical protein